MNKSFLGALKSKTMWFNAITFVLAVLSLKEVVAVLPASFIPHLVFINAIGNLILRTVTNQPLSGKVK